MFRIKICGITSLADARAAVEAGADAVGLNFHSASPRYVTRQQAAEIVGQLTTSVCKVGVFVNASAGEVREVVRELRLDLAQLHGDETPQTLRELRGIPVMKAFRYSGDLAEAADYLGQCYHLNCLPRMVLIDAHQAGKFGGTGQTVDWLALQSQRGQLGGLPLVLAGGLTPDNVAQAITALHPWAIDTASGVESAPGKKSHDLMQRFVEEAKSAFLVGD